MDRDQPLTRELLDGLEARWKARGVPLLERLAPGLTDEEIDATMAPLGLRLPAEAREWWRWHDGVPATAINYTYERHLGPRLQYLPLAEAVERYRRRRAEVAEDPSVDDPTYWWHPLWFPVVRSDSGEDLAVDCGVGEGEPSPVRLVDWWREDFMNPLACSLGAAIAEWVDAFDTDRWRWVAEGEGRWERQVVDGFPLS
jgi:cell wall assembly regulator SMI1